MYVHTYILKEHINSRYHYSQDIEMESKSIIIINIRGWVRNNVFFCVFEMKIVLKWDIMRQPQWRNKVVNYRWIPQQMNSCHSLFRNKTSVSVVSFNSGYSLNLLALWYTYNTLSCTHIRHISQVSLGERSQAAYSQSKRKTSPQLWVLV